MMQMTEQHQITPPPELVRQWAKDCSPYDVPADHIAAQAARWGADQELEACYEWLKQNCGRWDLRAALRAARRPKPPSLKERALQAMDRVDVIWATDEFGKETMDDIDAIRRALEQLDD